MNTQYSPSFSPSTGVKRLLFFASPGTRPGSAETSEELRPEQSGQTMMDKVKQVYVMDDAEEFVKTFDFLDVNLSNIQATGKIDADTRDFVMQELIGRMSELTSQASWNKIDDLQKTPLGDNEDVADSAKKVLEDLSRTARTYHSSDQEKADSESSYYENLAQVMDSMGLKKEQLMRTNELTGRVKTLEQARDITKTRLDLLQSHIQYVEELEKKSTETYSGWGKWVSSGMEKIINFGGGSAIGTAVAKGVAVLAGTSLAAFSLTGVSAGIVGGAATLGLYRAFRGNLIKGIDSYVTMANEDASTVNLQKQLLKKGKVTIKEGQYLYKFRTPQAIRLSKGSVIDGRTVTAESELAPAGAVISGEAHQGGEIHLPQVKNADGGLVYATEKNLKELHAEQQEQVNEVQALLNQHNAEVGLMQRSFDTQYTSLFSKVKDAERIMGEMSQQRALAKMRADQGQEGADEELRKAENAFEEARSVMEHAKKALDALNQVKRVFGLNEQYAKQPVPAGVLKALYEQTVNPEALTLMMKLQEQQDREKKEEMKKAQESLKNMSKEQLQEKLMTMEDIADDQLATFLEKLEDNHGKSAETLEAEFPFLEALAKKDEVLYRYLISLVKIGKENVHAVDARQNLNDVLEERKKEREEDESELEVPDSLLEDLETPAAATVPAPAQPPREEGDAPAPQPQLESVLKDLTEAIKGLQGGMDKMEEGMKELEGKVDFYVTLDEERAKDTALMALVADKLSTETGETGAADPEEAAPKEDSSSAEADRAAVIRAAGEMLGADAFTAPAESTPEDPSPGGSAE